jgi:dTDP-4-dehydrorhamnose reductase
MKLLLIGKTGQLGGDILRNCRNDHEIYAPSRDILDIEHPDTVEKALSSFKPDVIINTAAFHNVPQCETESSRAYNVNFIAVRNLAILSKKAKALFVTFSTDYVFDGKKRMPYTEDDIPSPLQIYGLSKLAGEYAALSIWPEKTLVVRTCGLYGLSGASSKGGNFVDKRIEDARNTNSLEMSSDQVVCPTYTYDLSNAVLSLISQKDLKAGVYHLVNEGQCSWYEFTKAIYETMGLNIDLKPVDRHGTSGGVRRPLYSVLANTKAKAFSIELPHWKDALKRYLHAKYSDGVKV